MEGFQWTETILFLVCGLVLQEIRLLRPIKAVTWSTCMLELIPLKSSTKLSSEASFSFCLCDLSSMWSPMLFEMYN